MISHSGSLWKISPNSPGCLRPHVTNPSCPASAVSAKDHWAAPGHAAGRSSKVEKVVGGRSKSCLVGDAVLRTPEEKLLREALKVTVATEGTS